jgi:hypothetical protein
LFSQIQEALKSVSNDVLMKYNNNNISNLDNKNDTTTPDNQLESPSTTFQSDDNNNKNESQNDPNQLNLNTNPTITTTSQSMSRRSRSKHLSRTSTTIAKLFNNNNNETDETFLVDNSIQQNQLESQDNLQQQLKKETKNDQFQMKLNEQNKNQNEIENDQIEEDNFNEISNDNDDDDDDGEGEGDEEEEDEEEDEEEEEEEYDDKEEDDDYDYDYDDEEMEINDENEQNENKENTFQSTTNNNNSFVTKKNEKQTPTQQQRRNGPGRPKKKELKGLKRKRCNSVSKVYTDEITQLLEAVFFSNKYLNRSEKETVATATGLTKDQVETWFAQKRYKNHIKNQKKHYQLEKMESKNKQLVVEQVVDFDLLTNAFKQIKQPNNKQQRVSNEFSSTSSSNVLQSLNSTAATASTSLSSSILSAIENINNNNQQQNDEQIDIDEQIRNRRRTPRSYSDEITAHLLASFNKSPLISKAERRNLASITGLSDIQINSWFANFRQKKGIISKYKTKSPLQLPTTSFDLNKKKTLNDKTNQAADFISKGTIFGNLTNQAAINKLSTTQ